MTVAQRGAVDLFAGPGGWSEACLALGLAEVGVELDGWACETRAAAGHETITADVAQLDPLDHADREGLIASPPCPTFSSAGGRSGGLLTAIIVRALRDLAAGDDTRNDRRAEAYDVLLPVAWAAERAKAKKDKREPVRAKAETSARRDATMSLLVVEPLRWALATRPEWVALEQVPEVRPLWKVTAELLRAEGYSVWEGILEAERYGVPQTRERAILMASRVRAVHPPQATHQRYVKGEPQRHDVTLEGEVLPWVSMAQALGWGDPSALVGFPRRSDTPSNKAGGSVELDGVDYRERDLRRADEPAFAMTEKVRSWVRFVQNDRPNATQRDADEPAPTITAGHDHNERRWVLRTGMNSMSSSRDAQDMVPYERPVDVPAPTVDCKVGTAWKVAPEGEHADAPQRWKNRSLSAGTGENDIERTADEPAPTLRFGARLNVVQWVPTRHRPTHLDRRQTGGDGTPVPLRAVDDPAPTLGARGLAGGRDVWVHERPATTIACDPRVHPPGHKVNAADVAAGRDHYEGRAGENAIRVSVEEAAALQTFPVGYPWQGTKSKVFEQIGNAIPCLLAWHILAALVGPR